MYKFLIASHPDDIRTLDLMFLKTNATYNQFLA
jgi:hypothetical protein